ncbi:hypothetical protein PENARI_c004G04142 [Penicillium arizonense]|uniref:Uncharacterized protein n=1 Tax=Penicillium arizonense TaxID=1835702 RepID=A0A1F5LQW4_PENAI|nr:hypothetical protein PENARI_c004G04142 [Penicillium arizonense]OGE55593.1 hypothetical protein PENARI_c004G04142 [Penicillium arizonense]
MKFNVILGCIFALAGIAAAVPGPHCINRADPDRYAYGATGEIAAIKNCTAVLTDPHGKFRLTASEAQAAFVDLTLYTNAESCPMCASAIRWAGFREYVYGSSIDTLIQKGWGQIRISSADVFEASYDLPSQSRLMGDVLANETDPYFLWQFDPSYPCPHGCSRTKDGSSCRGPSG